MKYHFLPKVAALGGGLRPPARVRWAMRLTLLLPLLALTIATGRYVVDQGKLLLAAKTVILVAELSRQLHHEVRIGQITAVGRNGATIEHAAISSGRTFAENHGEILASADRVTVRYDLWALITDYNSPSHCIRDITFDHPYALIVRQSPSTFNFTEFTTLFKPKGQMPRKPFVAKLVFRNGTLLYRDHVVMGRLTPAAQVNEATGINAVADFSSVRYASFSGTGHGDGTRAADIAFDGDASRMQASRFRMNVHAKDVDAAYWSDYLKKFPQMRILSGRADVDFTSAKLGKLVPKIPDLFGNVIVRNAAIWVDPKVLRVPLRGVSGNFTFTGASLDLNAAATVAGQPLSLRGSVFDFFRPRVEAFAAVPRFVPSAVARTILGFPLPPGLGLSDGSGSLHFSGYLTSPVMTGNVALPNGSFYGNRISDARIKFSFVKKLLTIPSATFRWNGGGQVVSAASVDLTQPAPQVSLAGRGTGIALASLRFPVKPGARVAKFGGVADVKFLVSNVKQPLALTANVAVVNGQVDQYVAKSVEGRVAWSPGRPVTIRRAVLRGRDGVAAVAGTVPIGGHAPVWDLMVDAGGVNLGHLFPSSGTVDVGGLASFRGHVSGQLDAPVIAGAAQVYGGHLGKFTADTAAGDLIATRDAVAFRNVVVHRYPTEARVAGTISNIASKDPNLNLTVGLSQGDVQDFVALAGQFAAGQKGSGGRSRIKTPQQFAAGLPALTGTASGDFRVAGHLSALRVTGKTQIVNATVDVYRIDKALADVNYSDGTLHLDNGVLRGEGATATIHGIWKTKTGSLQMKFAGNDLGLEHLQRLTKPYMDLRGVADFSGSFGGTVVDPTVTLGVVARDLVVNGQNVAPFTGFAKYGNGVFEKTADPWEFRFLETSPSGSGQPAETRYVVNSMRLEIPTPGKPNVRPSIALTAQIPDEYPEHVPHLIETIRASKLGSLPSVQKLLAEADRIPRPLDGALTMPSLTVEGPLDALVVSGQIQGRNLVVSDNRLGHLTVGVKASGGTDGGVSVTMDAEDGRVAGIAVNELQAAASYANGIVNVTQLHLASDRADIDISGQANLYGAITASIDASNVPLSLFNGLLPQSRRLSGEISNISAVISGPTRSPDLTASIDLADPALTILPPAAAVKAISGAAAAAPPAPIVYKLDRVRSGTVTVASSGPGAGKVLTVTDLAASRNGKPVASLSGRLPFYWIGADGAAPELVPNQPLQADLSVKDLSLLTTLVPAIDSHRTAGSADVIIHGRSGMGLNDFTGTMTVNNATIAVTGFNTAFNAINGEIALGNGQAVIKSLSGKSTAGGGFALTGSAAADPEADSHLTLTLNNLGFKENDPEASWLVKTYQTSVNGQVTGVVAVDGSWRSPKISTKNGNLLISKASGKLPGASPVIYSAPQTPVTNPAFDLHVDLGTSKDLITVNSKILNADLLSAKASGTADLTGTMADPVFQSHLDIHSGHFTILPSTMMNFIKSPHTGALGYVDLKYPGLVKDPAGGTMVGLEKSLDLWAQARVSVSPSVLAAHGSAINGGAATVSSALNKPQRYTINVHVIGNLDDPDPTHDLLQPESSPGGLNKDQMLAALIPEDTLIGLLSGGAEQALSDQFTSALTGVAIPALLNPLTSSFAEILGLSALDVDLTPGSDTLVTLSKQILPNLEATYTRSLGARTPGAVNSVLNPPQYTLKLSYQFVSLKKGLNLQLSVLTDDQRKNTLALEGVFGF